MRLPSRTCPHMVAPVAMLLDIYMGVRRVDDTFELLPYVQGTHHTSVDDAVYTIARAQQRFNPINVRFYVMRHYQEGMFEVASSTEGRYPWRNYVQHSFKS